MNNKDRHRKYIYHGIYLQVFIGIGLIIQGIYIKEPNELFTVNNAGVLMVVFSLNSALYIRRYLKALDLESKNL